MFANSKSVHFTLVLFLLWVVVPLFLGCGEKEEEEVGMHPEEGQLITQEVDGYTISFSTNPRDIHAAANKPGEADLIFEVSDQTDQHMMRMEPHVHIKSADGKIDEEMEAVSKGEQYIHHHVFKQGGKYKIEFEFHKDGSEHMADFDLSVDEPH